jgi:hypothetical protein
MRAFSIGWTVFTGATLAISITIVPEGGEDRLYRRLNPILNA